MTAPATDTTPAAPDNAAPPKNPVIAGYRIGEQMGVGPLGKIYRAMHETTGGSAVFRGFARPDGADLEKWEAAKNQFRDLLGAQHRIDKHPVIPNILGFGEENGLFWIASEYFEGRTLQQILAAGGAQDLPWCIEVMRQVADAVDHAGEQGLPHTDLTPYNILLVNHADAPNRVDVRVINFGMAHARAKRGSRYAAPEQQMGSEGDRRSDVYAAGALLFEMLAGKPVFAGTTADEIARKVVSEPVLGLVGRPAYVQNVLGAMLAKEPRFRYATVGEAVEDLANKRSPAGVDRHDGVERGDGGRLAARRSERRAGDTAEGDLASAFGATSGGRPAADRIALQDYRLSEMDVLAIRYRAEKAKERAAAARETARGRWLPWARWGGAFAAVALLTAHTASVMAGYRTMRVAAVKGTATRQAVPAAGKAALGSPLVLGATIRASDLPLFITTGVDSRATLALSNGEAVTVFEGSTVELSELGYEGEPVRRFRVWRGVALFRAAKALRGSETFAVEAGGVRVKAGGAARFVVMDSAANDGTHFVRVASRAGTPTVVLGGDKDAAVPAGQRIAVEVPDTEGGSPISVSALIPLSADDTKAIAARESDIAGLAPPPALLRTLAAVEESLLMPVVEAFQNIAAIPARMNDGKNVAVAVTSMSALCTLVQTSGGENGNPESLDFQTLAPLSLPEVDKARILKGFQGGRIAGYRALPDGGYEILARANDTRHTWTRGRNGVASASLSPP